MRVHSPSRATVLACLTAASALCATARADAQQSYFNVPAVDTAAPGRLFAQAQGTFAADRGELNLTVDLGIVSWLEVGCNVLHVPLYDRVGASSASPADASALLNASVLGRPTPWLRLTLGAQAGLAWQGGATPAAVAVVEGWGAARFDLFDERLSLVAGAYVGTPSALGAGWPAGPMFGVEVIAIRDRLSVMADWLVGVNSASVAVAGLVLHLPAGTQLSAGAQLPSPMSNNAFGAVVELTYVPETTARNEPAPNVEPAATQGADPALPRVPGALSARRSGYTPRRAR